MVSKAIIYSSDCITVETYQNFEKKNCFFLVYFLLRCHFSLLNFGCCQFVRDFGFSRMSESIFMVTIYSSKTVFFLSISIMRPEFTIQIHKETLLKSYHQGVVVVVVGVVRVSFKSHVCLFHSFIMNSLDFFFCVVRLQRTVASNREIALNLIDSELWTSYVLYYSPRIRITIYDVRRLVNAFAANTLL